MERRSEEMLSVVNEHAVFRQRDVNPRQHVSVGMGSVLLLAIDRLFVQEKHHRVPT